MITFTVLGVPAPQGSHTAVNRGDRAIVIEGGSKVGREKHKAWREAVAWAAREHAPSEPLDGALKVAVAFRMPMPASRPAASRQMGYGWHSVKPDLDKLVRSTLDGIADGGVIVGDSRVAGIQASALEVVGWTGALIQVTALGLTDATAAHGHALEIVEALA